MADCRCSNITIMQLFHQLKQRFPTVPDHVVSKVIQQNCHDKTACETILQKESHNYVQCYPGALISGEGRPAGPLGPLSDRCSLGPGPPRHSIPSYETEVTAQPADCIISQHSDSSSPSSQSTPDEDEVPEGSPIPTPAQAVIFPEATTPRTTSRSHPPTLEEKIKLSKIPLSQLVQEAQERQSERVSSESHKLEPADGLPCDDKRSVALPAHGEPPCLPPVVIPSPVTEKPPRQPSPCNLPKELPYPSVPSHPQTETAGNRITSANQSSNPSVARSPARPTTLACDTPKTPSAIASSASPNRLHPPISPGHRSATASSGSSISSPNHGSSSRPHPRKDISPNALTPPHSDAFFGCAPPQESSLHGSRHSSPQEYKVAVECVVGPSRPGDRPGAFTSVNLTLRPPCTETPQPIDICSGQSVTYTTAKIDPRQGYQSHLQIRISPTGGTITAYRMRVTSPALRSGSRSPCRAGALCHSRPHVRALLQKQRERKDLLARELLKEKDKLYAMRIQVRAMQTALTRFKPSPLIVNRLKADRDRLRAECERLTAAVDQYLDPPSGEPDDSFYSNLYTGQRQQRGGWSCRLCTFQNHPLLTECEQCEMPRLLGTINPDPVSNPHHSNNNSFFVAGETSGSVSRTIAPLQER